jgi:hypothetical protein
MALIRRPKHRCPHQNDLVRIRLKVPAASIREDNAIIYACRRQTHDLIYPGRSVSVPETDYLRNAILQRLCCGGRLKKTFRVRPEPRLSAQAQDQGRSHQEKPSLLNIAAFAWRYTNLNQASPKGERMSSLQSRAIGILRLVVAQPLPHA